MTLKMGFFDNWNLNVIYNSLNDVCKLLIIAHKQVVRERSFCKQENTITAKHQYK
jgi:hypothetical protein